MRASPIRALWFSNVPPPAVCKKLGLQPAFGCWWVYSLLQALAGRNDVEITVAWADLNSVGTSIFEEAGITYYIFPGRHGPRAGTSPLKKALAQLRSGALEERALTAAKEVVERTKPDIVQVFGTETYYGLLATEIQTPLVIWLQGILHAVYSNFYGSMPQIERLLYPRLAWEHYQMLFKMGRERRVFSRCRFYQGRTTWDATQQRLHAPSGRYYPVQEIMRPEFYEAVPWSGEKASKTTVYTTTSAGLWKGTDVLLRAVASLMPQFPEIRLRIAGVLDSRYPVAHRLVQMVSHLGLDRQVEFLGQLDALRIITELQRARVFVLPSFIENSPNSLAEAQLVGTPVIASLVGGVPDMVVNGETGLLFPPGNAAALADRIAQLLNCEDTCSALARRERKAAHLRHSAPVAAANLHNAYAEILRATLKKNSHQCKELA